MTEWPEFLLPTCILSNLNHSQSVNVFSVETAGPGKTPQCTEGKLTLTFWNVAWVDCESKMGLASAHIHNWGRPLATTRVDIFGTHSRTQLTRLGCFITATVWSASCSRGHHWGSGSSQHQHLCFSLRSLLLTCLFCQPEKVSFRQAQYRYRYFEKSTA